MSDNLEPQDALASEEQPVETPLPEDAPAKARAWAGPVGIVSLIALVVCLGALTVNLVRQSGWSTTNTILLVVGALAVVGAAAAYWEQVTSRGTMLSLNAIVSTAAVLAILVVGNKIIERRMGYVKADWTAEKFYSLSSQTSNMVRKIEKKDAVEIVALVPSSQYSDTRSIGQQTRMLEEYGRLSPNVTVKVLDPYIDDEGRQLAESGAISAVPGAVIRRKDNPEVREGVTGIEEKQITQGLMKLLDSASRKVYFITGHGERGLDDTQPGGLSTLKQLLTDDRYETAELQLATQPEVPADAAAVIIVGPKKPFSDEELARLESYLSRERGGRLLAFLDPDGESNLGGLTAKYGIDYHPDLVTDPNGTLQVGSEATIFGTTDLASHETTELYAKRFLTVFVRAGRLTQGTAGEFELTDLIKSSSAAYASPPKAAPKPKPAAGEPTAEDTPVDRIYGPLALAMVATTKDPEPPADDDKAEAAAEKPNEKRVRVAVVADADFASNALRQAVNLDISANLVAWLTDNTKAIGIRAKSPTDDMEKRKITIDRKGKLAVTLLTLALPLLIVTAAGIAVQIVRR